MSNQPFSVYRLKNKPNHYVQFKNETTGCFTSAISTRQTNKADAMTAAWAWYASGIPRKESKQSIAKRPLINTASKADLTAEDAEKIISELKRKRLVKSAVMADSNNDRDFVGFLMEFWDFDVSPAIKEKLRKNHSIHRAYVTGMHSIIIQYWKPRFADKLLGEITRQDIDKY